MRPLSHFQLILQLDLRWPLTLICDLLHHQQMRAPMLHLCVFPAKAGDTKTDACYFHVWSSAKYLSFKIAKWWASNSEKEIANRRKILKKKKKKISSLDLCNLTPCDLLCQICHSMTPLARKSSLIAPWVDASVGAPPSLYMWVPPKKFSSVIPLLCKGMYVYLKIINN